MNNYVWTRLHDEIKGSISEKYPSKFGPVFGGVVEKRTETGQMDGRKRKRNQPKVWISYNA